MARPLPKLTPHAAFSLGQRALFMTAVILTIHSLIVLGLIAVVLLQRSEGGALGMGGGGVGGGFMTGRGAANALTRTTSVLAALFFATSLILAIRAGGGESQDDIADELTGTGAPVETQDSGERNDLSADDLLNSLGASDNAPETVVPADEEDLIEELGGEVPAEARVESTGDAAAEDSAPATNDPESGDPEAETAPVEDTPEQ